jgi:hypothetical protein
MYLPIEFKDVANEENKQVFNANQSKDEMSECYFSGQHYLPTEIQTL